MKTLTVDETNLSQILLTDTNTETFDQIIWSQSKAPSRPELKVLASKLTSTGTLELHCTLPPSAFLDCLLAGLSKPSSQVSENGQEIQICQRKTLSSAGVSVPLRAKSGSEELVDEDSLLQEEDKLRPVPVADCTSGAKKRACKDCTCGLAEQETQQSAPIQKSSCGSVLLSHLFLIIFSAI
jgi:hypothetical protein